MKNTSIKKLSEVYAQLRGDVELDRDQAALAIKEVLRAESPTSGLGKRKFDLYNYVGKNELRPFMSGVFYDTDGTKVASDAHILVALNGEPDEDTAGKIIAKDGSEIQGIYPKYKSLLPTDWKEAVRITKEMRDGFSEFVKECRGEYKAQYGKGCKWESFWTVVIKGVAFKAEFFSRWLDAMDELGTDEIWLRGICPAAIKSDKGWGLLMPLAPGWAEGKPGVYTMA